MTNTISFWREPVISDSNAQNLQEYFSFVWYGSTGKHAMYQCRLVVLRLRYHGMFLRRPSLNEAAGDPALLLC